MKKGRKDVSGYDTREKGDYCPECHKYTMYPVEREGKVAYQCIACGMVVWWKNAPRWNYDS